MVNTLYLAQVSNVRGRQPEIERSNRPNLHLPFSFHFSFSHKTKQKPKTKLKLKLALREGGRLSGGPRAGTGRLKQAFLGVSGQSGQTKTKLWPAQGQSDLIQRSDQGTADALQNAQKPAFLLLVAAQDSDVRAVFDKTC